jgi:hypothetical protein
MGFYRAAGDEGKKPALQRSVSSHPRKVKKKRGPAAAPLLHYTEGWLITYLM